MKLLVDTSAWIDHFHSSDPIIVTAITEGSLVCHEYVTTELALGSVPDRERLLVYLSSLEQIPRVSSSDLLRYIDLHGLVSVGIGLVDAQLLASASLHGDTQIWTKDKQLATQTDRLGLCYKSS